MRIGFIGLGNMGAPMARNLATAGHSVAGFDVAGIAVEGVRKAASGAEACDGCDVAITMLPDGRILRLVAEEIIDALPDGAVLIDCSTVDVESARAVAERRDRLARCAGFGRDWWGNAGHLDLHGRRVGAGFPDRAPAL